MRLAQRAILTAALLLVGTLGTVSVALAQSGEPRSGLVGTVKGDPAVGADTFVLTLTRKGGDPIGDVTIDVVSGTKFKIPGDKSVNSTNYNFANGDRVAVLGELVTGTTYNALHLHLIPAKGLSLHKHQVGTITAYDVDGSGSESITIQPKKGDPVSYTWTAGAATISVKKGSTSPYTDGERATLILKRNPDTGEFEVKGVLVFRAKGKP